MKIRAAVDNVDSRMSYLVVQLQPNLLAAFDKRSVGQLCALNGPKYSVQNADVQYGEDSGEFINITFQTPDPMLLWPTVRQELMRLGLHGASIVTCTGPNGWDDYVLLHHFSRDVPNDRR